MNLFSLTNKSSNKYKIKEEESELFKPINEDEYRMSLSNNSNKYGDDRKIDKVTPVKCLPPLGRLNAPNILESSMNRLNVNNQNSNDYRYELLNSKVDRILASHADDVRQIAKLNTSINDLSKDLDLETIKRKDMNKINTETKRKYESLENDIKILNKENELLKSEIKEIKVVLNEQNSRLNSFDINQNKLYKENNLMKKEIIKLFNQMNEIANDNDRMKSETIKLSSEMDILLRYPINNNINNNTSDGKETNENFKNSSDFSKWASLLTKVTNSERTIYDEMRERKLLSDKVSKIENQMNDTIRITKSNEEKIKSQSNDEEKYNINFQQYKLLLDQYKDRVEIRLNRLDHNCCDTLIECKKLCKNLEEIIREEVKARMENEKDIDNKIFIFNNEEKNNQLNEYIKLENRINDMSNSLHSYIESEILENKLFINKHVSEQLEMINVLNNRCDELVKSDNDIIADMKIIDNNNNKVNSNSIKRINEIKDNAKEMMLIYECDKLVNQIILDEYKDYLLEVVKESENKANIAVDKINTNLHNELIQSIHCCRISTEQIGNKIESYNDDNKIKLEKMNERIKNQNNEIEAVKNKDSNNSDLLTLVGTLEEDINEIKNDINERFENVQSKEIENNNEIAIKTIVDSLVNTVALEYSYGMLYKSVTEMENNNQEILKNQYLDTDIKNMSRITELEKYNNEKIREENNRIGELEMKHKEDIELLEEKIKQIKAEKDETVITSEINKKIENEKTIKEFVEKVENNNDMKISTVKSELDERIKKIEEKEKEKEESKEKINKLEEMEKKMKNIENDISAIKKERNENGNNTEKTQNSVKEYNVKEYVDKVERIDVKVFTMKKDIDERLKKIEEKESNNKPSQLSEIEDKIKKIEDELSTIKKEKDEEVEVFHSKGIDYSEINKNINNEKTIKELLEKVENGDKKISTIKDDIDEKLKKIEEKEEEESKDKINKLEEIEKKVKNIENEVGRMKNEIVKERDEEGNNDLEISRNSENEKKLKELTDKVECCDINLSNIKNDLTEKIKKIEKRGEEESKEKTNHLDDIENKMKKIEDEVFAIKNEKIKAIYDKTGKEIKDINSLNDKEEEMERITQRLTSLEETRKEMEKLANGNDVQNISKISEVMERIKTIENSIKNNSNISKAINKEIKNLVIDIGCMDTIDKIITNIVEEVDINSLFEEDEEDEYIPVEDDKYHKGYDKENDSYYYFNRKTGDTTFDVPKEWKEKKNIKIGDIIENGKFEVCATSEGELYKKNIENGECEML